MQIAQRYGFTCKCWLLANGDSFESDFRAISFNKEDSVFASAVSCAATDEAILLKLIFYAKRAWAGIFQSFVA